MGHWKCDTFICAHHQQTIVTVEYQSRNEVIASISKNKSVLVGSAVTKAPKPLKARVKTLTYDNGKEFSGYAVIDAAFGI